jgi:hypothetical protein
MRLLTVGGADIEDVNSSNRNVWIEINAFFDLAKLGVGVSKLAKDDEISSLLRFMSLLSDAKPISCVDSDGLQFPVLELHHAQLIAQGQRLRAHFPAYLDQQRALLAQHIPLPTALQPLIAAYATPTQHDMRTSGLPFSAETMLTCKQARYCGRECQQAH